MVMVLFLFVLNSGHMETLKPSIVIDDTMVPESDGFLVYPHDALNIDARIYVADQSHSVFVFTSEGYLMKFGAKGEGPAEFSQPPVRLTRVPEGLRITEMYGWSHSFYTLDGEFIRKESIDQRDKYIGSWLLRDLPSHEALARGARMLGQDCELGTIGGSGAMDFHYSSFVLDTLDDGTLFFVKRRGAVEVYDTNCTLTKEVELGLGRFFKEPEYNKLFTQVSRTMLNDRVKRYYYGHPIYSVAGQDQRFLWMLVSNEHYETFTERRQQVWLFRADLKHKNFDFSARLPMSPYKVIFSEGKLALIYKDEATIHFYDVDQLISHPQPFRSVSSE